MAVDLFIGSLRARSKQYIWVAKQFPRLNILLVDHMSEQRERNTDDDTRGRDGQRRRRERSPQVQDIGREARRVRRSRSPSYRAYGAQGSSSRRSRSSERIFDAASVLAHIKPEWEVDQTMRLPLHMRNCADCAHFAKHVAEETQGGALALLIDKLKKHWRRELGDEVREDCNEAFRDGLREGDKKIEELEEELDRSHRRASELEDDNNALSQRVRMLEDMLRRAEASNSQLKSSASRGRARAEPVNDDQGVSMPQPLSLIQRIATVRRSPSPVRVFLPRLHKAMKEAPLQSPQGPSPCPLTAGDDAQSSAQEGAGKKLVQMFLTDEEDSYYGSDAVSLGEEEDDECQRLGEGHTSANMAVDDVPPVIPIDYGQRMALLTLPSSFIGDPAPFRLNKNSSGFKSCHGHACLNSKTKWDNNGERLMIRWIRSEGGIWFWKTGFLMQMAREASYIPFDQRSILQRWTVREATHAGSLPFLDERREPDVEGLAKSDQLPNYLRRDKDGRVNVLDITSWLLLKMTEPEEPIVKDWYWWQACLLLERLGSFGECLACCRVTDDERGIAPRRFTQAGSFSADDIARHLAWAGARCRDANTHL